jgi:ribosomal protein S18 acetylase RimI-like enzyme
MRERIIQRNFRESDLPHIIGFKKESTGVSFPGRDLEPERFAMRLTRYMKKYPEQVQVLEKGGTVVGYIWFGMREGDLGRYGFLHQLFIRKDLRRQGLANRLLSYAEGYLRSNGAKSLTLNVTEANVPAVKFYEKMQYKRTRLVMEKRL